MIRTHTHTIHLAEQVAECVYGCMYVVRAVVCLNARDLPLACVYEHGTRHKQTQTHAKTPAHCLSTGCVCECGDGICFVRV